MSGDGRCYGRHDRWSARAVDELLRLYAVRGEQRYVRGAVSQRAHALHAATLAEREGAPSALVAAALLHDIGHLLRPGSPDITDMAVDHRHEEVGAHWLAGWFGPEVTEPVRLHVTAKRYLCTVDDAYLAALSPAAIRTLAVQGGPLPPAQARAFERHPFRDEALWLRRLDDRASGACADLPGLEFFREHLELLVRAPSRAAAL